MPVVMTGSPGGSIGGNSGGSFGSGLGGLTTSPRKLFTPALETWTKRSEEDRLMIKERKAEYETLRDARLAMVSGQGSKETNRRQKNNDAFAQRQKQRLEAEAGEKARVARYRKESLEKPTLGSPEPPWAHLEEKCGAHVGTRPAEWLWPTEKKHPEAFVGLKGLGAEHEEAMIALPANIDKESLHAYANGITHNSMELTRQAAEVRRDRDAELAEVAELEKREREEAAMLMRAEVKKKEDARTKAELQRKKQIKKEMAEETAKFHKDKAQADKVRYDKAQAERVEMVRHLKMDMKLRDEDEIANERREGSSMSKGGKADFVSAAKTAGNDDMVGF